MDPLLTFPLRPPLPVGPGEDDLRQFLEGVQVDGQPVAPSAAPREPSQPSPPSTSSPAGRRSRPDRPGRPGRPRRSLDAKGGDRAARSVSPRLAAYLLGLVVPADRPLLLLGGDPGLAAVLEQFSSSAVVGARLDAEASERTVTITSSDFTTGRPRRHEMPLALGPFDERPLPYADASFATVVCHETIERCERDPEHLLDEIARVLPPDGVLVIVTPNAVCLENVVRLIDGEAVVAPLVRDPGTRYRRITRECTPDELRDLMDDAGHLVERVFTADVEANEATSIHRVAPMLRIREHDLGQYTFLKARRAP